MIIIYNIILACAYAFVGNVFFRIGCGQNDYSYNSAAQNSDILVWAEATVADFNGNVVFCEVGRTIRLRGPSQSWAEPSGTPLNTWLFW